PSRFHNHGVLINTFSEDYSFDTSLGQAPFSPDLYSFVNGFAMQSNSEDTKEPSSSILCSCIANLRPVFTSLSGAKNPPHLLTQSDDMFAMPTWASYYNFKDYFSECVYAHEVWCGSPGNNYITNSIFRNQVTNTLWLTVMSHLKGSPYSIGAWDINNGLTNGILAQDLTTGGSVVWLINEHPTATTNLSFNFSSLTGIPANAPCNVQNVWSNTPSTYTVQNVSSYSTVVNSNSTELYIISAMTNLFNGQTNPAALSGGLTVSGGSTSDNSTTTSNATVGGSLTVTGAVNMTNTANQFVGQFNGNPSGGNGTSSEAFGVGASANGGF